MITTVNQLVDALANNNSRFNIEKIAIPTSAIGHNGSLWTSLGQPGGGAIPTTAAITTNATLGAIPFTQQTAPATSYLAILEAISGVNGQTLEIHDRLMHMGGLNGTLTSLQTVDLDLHANIGTSNLAVRKGDANYSDVQWWLEWYADTGPTGSNATVNVTFNDGTTADLSVFNIGSPATSRLGRMVSLNNLLQAADQGKFIRDVNSVTLSASTGTAGNFGVTATRYRGSVYCPILGARYNATWTDLNLPEIHNSSCLFPVFISNSGAPLSWRGRIKVVHG